MNRLALIPTYHQSTNEPEPRTVRARRRRRTDSSGSGDRPQAEAPRRRRPWSSTPAGSGGGTGSGGGSGSGSGSSSPPVFSFGGGQMPNRSTLLLLAGAVVILCVCVLPVMFFFNGGDSGLAPAGDDQLGQVQDEDFAPAAEVEPEEAPVLPSRTPRPAVAPATTGDGQTWLVMLYQDADDKILEQDIFLDLNEAERIGSTDRVQIVAQVDRYQGGFQGDGNWTAARRYYITQDDDLNRLGSQPVDEVGEANMSAGETLVDFVSWAVENYPADRHVLIMSDHGMGWPGGWSDPAPQGGGPGGSGGSGASAGSTPLESALGNQMYLNELDAALGDIRARTGLAQFELVGLDACLMSHLEVYSALAEHARYAVASQETEPAVGWAYAAFLGDLVANPDMDGAELGRRIVESYIREDERVVDDQARAEYLRGGSPMGGLSSLFGGGGLMSADQLAQQLGRDVTMSAVDMGAIAPLIAAFNNFAFALQDARQQDVAQARNYAQSFTNIFGNNVPKPYIDLGHFAELVREESGGSTVVSAADALFAALGEAVIAETHGPGKSGSTGISIYFPNSQLYQLPTTGPQSYNAIAGRFANESLWDDFLAYHYAGRPFDITDAVAAAPDRTTTVAGPGAGAIALSPLTLSDATAAAGQPVLMSAEVSGENIGYIYFFSGFVDEAANSLYVADSDYLESDDTRQLDGVYYPDWGEGAFTLEFEWEPIVYAISDGVNSVQALLTPATYGASFEEAVYTVDGIYTYTDGESRYARLYFRDGLLQQVFGFSGEDGTGAPREITPAAGDTFTVLERWLDLDAQGQVTGSAQQEGGVLTFSDQMFTWQELDAAPGQYVIGFIVEDLDGNRVESYAPVRVE